MTQKEEEEKYRRGMMIDKNNQHNPMEDLEPPKANDDDEATDPVDYTDQ